MTKIEVPVSWGWERYIRSSMTVDKNGLRLQKSSVNPDYSVALASAGFSTGVHCWVLRIETCQRLVLGVCRGSVDLDRRVNPSADAWAWHSHGTMSGPEQGDLEIGDYSSRDTLSLRLDMDRGTLEFFKNGELKGCLSRITGEVFPFVCMDYEGEEVLLQRRYDVVELEAAAVGGEVRDFAEVCSRALSNLMNLLNALMDEDGSAPGHQQLAAAALESILRHFSSFLEHLDAQTPARAHRMLALLDYMTLGTAAPGQPALNWLSSALVLAARLMPAAGPCERLLPRMVECAILQRRFIRRHRPTLMYRGTHFRSFALKGLSLSRANAYCEVEHKGPCEGEWTVEVLMKRGKLLEGCKGSILFDASQFALCVDRPKGNAGMVNLVDYTIDLAANPAGAAGLEHYKQWSLDASCPADCWVLLTLVCDKGATSLYLDGKKMGCIPKRFSLAVTAVGASLRNPDAAFFCGAVRHVRALSRALSQDEIVGSLAHGLRGAHLDAALADDLLVFLDFPAKGDTMVAESAPASCVAKLCGVRGREAGDSSECEEEHWLCLTGKILNGLAASMATNVLRPPSDDEATGLPSVSWLSSPLFAAGLRTASSAPVHRAIHLLQQQPAQAQLDRHADVRVLHHLLQPLLAVRHSRDLDALEVPAHLPGAQLTDNFG